MNGAVVFKRMLDTDAGWGMTIVRIPIGVIYMGHGLPKWGWMGDRTFEQTANWLGNSVGLPFPSLMAFLIGCTEIFGGAMLIIGLATRFAALAQVIAMLIAIFMVHWANGMFGDGGYQWALALLACSAALLVEGAGKASVDKVIAERLG